MSTALITGVRGQDGAYLARFLARRGYRVHGTTRGGGAERPDNLAALGVAQEVTLHRADLAQSGVAAGLLQAVQPDEVYHLACPSSVGRSFREPAAALQGAVLGTVQLLEAIRLCRPQTRFYHSASGDMYGGERAGAYSETDAPRPRSPYGVGKAAAHWAVRNYRESFGLFACSGILFNHESPLRSEAYVTRKITRTAARIRAGLAHELRLGDLGIQRDWGYAEEYVTAMWLMLQRPVAEDYVIATGEAHALADFVQAAFEEVGLDWREHVVSDPAYMRPNEVRCSVGDPARAREVLGWSARTGFRELVRLMVRHDVAALEGEARLDPVAGAR